MLMLYQESLYPNLPTKSSGPPSVPVDNVLTVSLLLVKFFHCGVGQTQSLLGCICYQKIRPKLTRNKNFMATISDTGVGLESFVKGINQEQGKS